MPATKTGGFDPGRDRIIEFVSASHGGDVGLARTLTIVASPIAINDRR
jgi:hypothetical protein